MDPTRKTTSQSVWESQKDTILDLYKGSSLKEVQREMQELHGFCASSSQYQKQFKHWGIRKNRTRRQWQQILSNSDKSSNPISSEIPPVIHRKVQASIKRAKRWVPMPLAQDVSPCSGSTQPATEAQRIPKAIPNLPLMPRIASQADIQVVFPDVAETMQNHGGAPVHNEPSFSNMSATDDLQSSSQLELFAVTNGLAHSSDFGITASAIWPNPMMPDFQASAFGPEILDLDFSSLMELPESSDAPFFPFEDATFGRDLPFAILENIVRPNSSVTGSSFAGSTYSGFASRSITTILPSRDRFMALRASGVKLCQRKLGSLIPGESFDLITDSQVFEINFVRMLIFSILNGFAGLDDVPLGDILRFLNHSVVKKLFLDVLWQCPPYMSRTLRDNIFRVAIEAADAVTVELMLSDKLIDANETICFYEGRQYTPIERAASLGSLQLIRLLINGDADVHKSYHKDFEYPMLGYYNYGALEMLVVNILDTSERGRLTIPSDLVEAFHKLVEAGAEVKLEFILSASEVGAMELFCLISQQIQPEKHRGLFETFSGTSSWEVDKVVQYLDDHTATTWFRDMFRHCNQLCHEPCLFNGHDFLRSTAISAASTGKLELIRLLEKERRVDPQTPEIFTAAIASQSYLLIEFILGFGPDLDPPAIKGGWCNSTPIAEAVRYGNVNLIQKLEHGGALDHLTEGGRFVPLLRAAAEAGNVDYVRKLLHQPITVPQSSGNACEDPLTIAAEGGHREIVQMLLKAGATRETGKNFGQALCAAMRRKDAQMMRDLIEFQHPTSYELTGPFLETLLERIPVELADADCALIGIVVDEYPGIEFGGEDIQEILGQCIKTDHLPFFRMLLQNLANSDLLLDDCLKTAIEFRHPDLIEYLIDMGASPFNRSVLQCTMPDRPDLLRQLLKHERQRQTIPICIGAGILESVIGDGPRNSEALDMLLKTKAINFTRLDKFMGWGYGFEEYALTPLGLAIQGSFNHRETNITAMEKFLKEGADPDGIAKAKGRCSRCSPLMTALVVAVGTGREDAVEMLLRYGAHVDACPRLGTTRTALQHAAECGNANMVKLLLNNGAKADDTSPPRGGATALQFAAMSGNLNIAEELLAHNANLGALPSRIDGRWPLEGAAESGRLDMIKFLWKLYLQSDGLCAGFSNRQCLRAMNFARLNGHLGCVDLISELSKIPVDKLETENYGEPWMSYEIDYA